MTTEAVPRTVSEIMTSPVLTVFPWEDACNAARVMDSRHVRHLPVIDRDRRLVGVLSYRSVLHVLATAGKLQTQVGELMQPRPQAVTPSTSCLEAIGFMRSQGHGCLPVVDHGRLVGIVTAADFVDASAGLLDRWLRE